MAPAQPKLSAPSPDPQLLARAKSLQGLFHETPIHPLQHAGMRLFAKLEYHNPFGSLKDRAAFYVLFRAIERGDLHAGSIVVESSSGNFAVALAYCCKLLGLEFIPVVDPNLTPSLESLLRQHCPRLVKVEQRDETGGFLKTRLHKVEELCATLPGAFWTNQYANPDNMDAHYRLTGSEICKAMDRLDLLFVGVSSAGTVSGISRRLKEHFPQIRVIAVDVQGSIIFGGPPQRRNIPGIGSSISPPLLQHALIDEVVMVSEAETVEACHELLSEHGLFVGGSTGSVYAAIRRFVPAAGTEPTALFLCADRGTAYLDTVFNPDWAARLAR